MLQVIQYLAEDPVLHVLDVGHEPGLLVCTQPRRLAAVSTATRVSEEFSGEGKLGQQVCI